MRAIIAVSALGAGLAFGGQMAFAAEFYIGEPVVKEGMQLVPNYLTGIEMDRHPPGMSMDPNSIHVEIDVHATKDEKHGFSEDAWIPYLSIATTVEKLGSKHKEAKKLAPMTAGDGPHYANNFKMDGEGQYKITYVIEPPSKQGFIRHVDKATGVPAWWEPISVSWTLSEQAEGEMRRDAIAANPEKIGHARSRHRADRGPRAARARGGGLGAIGADLGQ